MSNELGSPISFNNVDGTVTFVKGFHPLELKKELDQARKYIAELVGVLEWIVEEDETPLFIVDFATGEAERRAGLTPREIAKQAINKHKGVSQ